MTWVTRHQPAFRRRDPHVINPRSDDAIPTSSTRVPTTRHPHHQRAFRRRGTCVVDAQSGLQVPVQLCVMVPISSTERTCASADGSDTESECVSLSIVGTTAVSGGV